MRNSRGRSIFLALYLVVIFSPHAFALDDLNVFAVHYPRVLSFSDYYRLRNKVLELIGDKLSDLELKTLRSLEPKDLIYRSQDREVFIGIFKRFSETKIGSIWNQELHGSMAKMFCMAALTYFDVTSYTRFVDRMWAKSFLLSTLEKEVLKEDTIVRAAIDRQFVKYYGTDFRAYLKGHNRSNCRSNLKR